MGVPPGREAFLDHCCIRSGDVRQDVPVPSNQLLEDDPEEQDHRHVLASLFNLVQRHANAARVLIAPRRHVVQILLDVIGVDVVAAMTRLPTEVGSQQERVEDEADRVIQDRRLRKSTMACIVGDDPESGPYDALTQAISSYDTIVQERGLLNQW